MFWIFFFRWKMTKVEPRNQFEVLSMMLGFNGNPVRWKWLKCWKTNWKCLELFCITRGFYGNFTVNLSPKVQYGSNRKGKNKNTQTPSISIACSCENRFFIWLMALYFSHHDKPLMWHSKTSEKGKNHQNEREFYKGFDRVWQWLQKWCIIVIKIFKCNGD